MKDLSIIIKADEEEIKTLIKLIEPLINSCKSELILINNEKETLDIPYDYSLYRYTQDYSRFKEFCFASSTGKRVMIIEKGMEFAPEIVDAVKNGLKNSDYSNISCNFKTYISTDRSLFFIKEKVIIYTRGIKGFNLNIGITAEDFSLININKHDIETNIEKLIKDKYFNELYSWYENCILKKPEDFITAFYNILEKKKTLMDKDDVKKLDEIFLSSGKENRYIDYLSLKKLCLDDNEKVINRIGHLRLTPEDKYFSWLLKEYIEGKKYTFNFLKELHPSLQKIFILYLLENSSDFNEQLYDFIVYIDKNKELSIDPKNNLELYLTLVEIYIEYMMDISEEPAKKQKLLQVFELYMDYSSYLLNPDLKGYKSLEYDDEMHFISETVRAKNLIKSNDFNEAYDILKKISLKFPQKSKVIQYYIQKLRHENNYYPYILSICMIVKNEEKNLDRCLLSIKPLLNSGIAELIVVDTGSTDKTIQIAKKYTDKVFSHPWQGSFSEGRNYSISLADGEYVFIIDADEEFEKDEIKKLVNEFSGGCYKQYNTFTFKHISYTDQSLTQYTVMTQPRIFKNDGTFFYSSSVHNQPVYNYPVKNLDIKILHYGYIVNPEVMEKKFQRTASLLKKELEKNPKNIYYRYQLCASYAMHDDIKEALNQVEIYMRNIKEENTFNEVYLMYYSVAASIYIGNYNYDEAEKICDEALSIKPDFIDFIFNKAFILFHKEKYSDALIYINKYMELIDIFLNSDIANDSRFSFNTLSFKDDVIRLYITSSFRLGKYEDCIKKAYDLKNNRLLQNCLHEIVASYFYTGRYSELAEFFKSRIEKNSNTDIKDVFTYFLVENLFNCTKYERQKCISSFTNLKVDEKYIINLNLNLQKESSHNEAEMLSLLEKYDMDGMDFNSANNIFSKIMPVFKSFNISPNSNSLEIRRMKIFAQYVLHRTTKFIELQIMTDEELVSIFQKYMNLCSQLMNMKRRDLLEIRERYFIANILYAIDEIKAENYEKAVEYMDNSIINYNEMEGIVELAKQILIPGYYEKVTADNKDSSNNEGIKYIEDLKSKINELTDSGNTGALLELFEQYNKTQFYDSALYSIKALALMLQNKINEAEACLMEGLNRYPEDIHILYNLSRLYHMKQDYKKSIETFCKAKIIKPEENCLDLSQIIQKGLLITDNHEIKVLHGTMDLTNKTVRIVQALKNKGIYARALNYTAKYVGYSSDYVMDVNSFDSGKTIQKRTIDAASKLMSEFDIFHFHYGMTLTFNHSDLPALKELGKKVFMQFWGQDARLYSRAVKFNPYIGDRRTNEEEIKRKLELLSKYIPCCIVNDYEINEYVKDYFEDVRQINLMVDVNKFKPVYEKNKKDKFIIVHAPTSQELKGTRFVLSAVEALKEKYPFIDFRLIQGVPCEKALKMYEEADLIIDQLIIGSYGHLSIEAMALGKPVICWISDFMKDNYPKELPIIIANPDNIKEKIEYAVKNKDMLQDLGVKGRLYAEKYHDINKEINKIIDLYREKK